MKYNPKKHKLPEFRENGILLVNKPKEWTSHDIVNLVRARFNIPKVGHCGTLDPAATGLLVLVLGKFTKLSQKFSGEDKVYEATMLLGTETDSQDMDGKIIAQNNYSSVTEDIFMDTLATFSGEQEQVPPMMSAVKVDGNKLYELARKGVEIEREPKKITIHSIAMTRFSPPHADFTVKCSKGTYVRTICADLGKKLGCGGALFALKRTVSGSFDISDAIDVETIKNWTQEDLSRHVNDFLHKKVAKMAKFTEF